MRTNMMVSHFYKATCIGCIPLPHGLEFSSCILILRLKGEKRKS